MKSTIDPIINLLEKTPEEKEAYRKEQAERREGIQGLSNLMGDCMDKLEAITIKAPNGYQTTIEINSYEFDCVIDYEIEPACKGGRGDFGMQTEPDVPAQINMGEVWIKDGSWQLVDIPEKAMKDVLGEILEHELG